MSLNVSGLRDENERLAVLQWMSHLSLDYVCLQKTYVISLSESSSWFPLMVFLLWSPPVMFILVVLLFFAILFTHFATSRLTTVVVSSWPNSKFVNLSFVLLVCS